MKPPNRTLAMIVLGIIVLVLAAAVYTVISHPSEVRPANGPKSPGSPTTSLEWRGPAAVAAPGGTIA